MPDESESHEDYLDRVLSGELSENGLDVSDEEAPHYDSDESYGYELQKLKAQHHQIIRLAATGRFKGVEIAELLNITPQTVYNTLNSKLAKQKLRYMRSQADVEAIDIRGMLERLGTLSVDVIEETLTSEKASQKLRTRTAQDLLDRIGHGKEQDVNLNHRKVDDDDIREIKQRANERAEETGMIEDANVVSEESDD